MNYLWWALTCGIKIVIPCLYSGMSIYTPLPKALLFGRIFPHHWISGPIVSRDIVQPPSIFGFHPHDELTHLWTKLRLFPSSISWSKGIIPVTIHVHWGRGSGATVVDDMWVWATCCAACLCSVLLLVFSPPCTFPSDSWTCPTCDLVVLTSPIHRGCSNLVSNGPTLYFYQGSETCQEPFPKRCVILRYRYHAQEP